MPENGNTNNNIAVVKVKIVIPRESSSGLIVLYLDTEKMNLMAHSSIIAVGQDCEMESLEKPHSELIDLINWQTKKLEINDELNNKMKSGLSNKINKEFIRSFCGLIKKEDLGTSENQLKRTLELILARDKTEVKMEYEMIGFGEFEEIKVIEEMEQMTFAQKIGMVKPYSANKNEISERIIRENIQDMAIVRFKYTNEKDVFGCGIIFFNILTRSIYKILLTGGRQALLADGDIHASIVDFFPALKELVKNNNNEAAIVGKIESVLKRVNEKQYLEMVNKEDDYFTDQVFNQVMAASVGEGFSIETDLMRMNSLKMHILIRPDTATSSEEKDKPAKPVAPGGWKVVLADLILSPTKGKNISSLRTGDNVQVILDSSNPIAMKILKGMNLIAGNKVKPIGSSLYSIKHDPKSGYTVYVKIADGVLGKAEEEQDIKIKTGDPAAEKEIKKATGSLFIGLIAGVAVLIIILILMFVL